MLHKYYDEGAEGGIVGTGDPLENLQPDSGVEGDNKPEGDEGEGGEPTGKEELTPEQQIESLTAKNTDWEGKYNNITKKLGEQSKTVGWSKALAKGLNSDALGTLKVIAKQYGVDLTKLTDSGTPNAAALTEVFASGDTEAQSKAVADYGDAIKNDVRGDIQRNMEMIQESNLARKYEGDWDALGDERDQLKAAHVTGNLPSAELYHLATLGMKRAEAMEEYGQKAVTDYKAQLAAKNAGQLGDPGTRGGGSPGKGQQVSTEDAVKALSGTW